MLKKVKELVDEYEHQIKFLKFENKPTLEYAYECIELYKKIALEIEKLERKNLSQSTNDIDWYYKKEKARLISYFFYFDTIIDCEKFKLKNNLTNCKLLFEMEKVKLENNKSELSEFLPMVNSCFDDTFFKEEICSKGFNPNNSLNN